MTNLHMPTQNMKIFEMHNHLNLHKTHGSANYYIVGENKNEFKGGRIIEIPSPINPITLISYQSYLQPPVMMQNISTDKRKGVTRILVDVKVPVAMSFVHLTPTAAVTNGSHCLLS